MNIIVNPKGCDLCYCRPDTTWERENKNFYVPDTVDSLYWTPILFARISKAGKCINPKFASRYYDAFNFGMLIYTGNGDIAFTSCCDHRSILPAPLYNIVVMDSAENICNVEKNGEPVFSSHPDKMLIENAICKASQMTSIRIGDYIAVELTERSLLADRKDGETLLKATFCENDLYDFKVIF